MAGDWIKVQVCTPDKPEVHQIAERLDLDPDAVTGKLLRIWCWADQHTSDGNAPSVTKLLLDRLVCVTGFADALLHVGWLRVTDEGFQFPNFERHNGQSAKTRAASAKRVEKHRKKAESPSAAGNARGVTKALPEKRREEKRRESIYTPGEDVVIPGTLDVPEVRAAVAAWLQHLADMDARTGTDKAIRPNSPQENSMWATLLSWHATTADTAAAIHRSIAAGWQNLRPPEQPRQQAGNQYSKAGESFLERGLRIAREADERERQEAILKGGSQ